MKRYTMATVMAAMVAMAGWAVTGGADPSRDDAATGRTTANPLECTLPTAPCTGSGSLGTIGEMPEQVHGAVGTGGSGGVVVD